MVYFTTDNDGTIKPVIDSGNSNKIERVTGMTSGLSNFNIRFHEDSHKGICSRTP